MIVIVDYGLGNVGSITNMLKKIGYANILITKKPDDINRSEKIIFPGVGAFDSGMKSIHELGLYDVLNDNVLNKKKKILGICLGMQLMTKLSSEGVSPGFGWLDATVSRFNFADKSGSLKIPHMGWNRVVTVKNSSLLLGLEEAKFYFVHSYHAHCLDSDVLMTSDYGGKFVCAFEHENIFGVQFHPEKSHKFGMKLLSNFLAI